MWNKVLLFVSLAMALSLAGPVSADEEIMIPDAGFDDQVLSVGGYTYVGEGPYDDEDSDYPGPWQSSGGDAWIDHSYYAGDGDLPAASGDNKVYGYEENEDSVYQILGETWIEGATYTLSCYEGSAWSDYDDGWWLYFTGEDYDQNLAEASGNGPVGEWQQVSLVYTATGADAGNKIGIKMKGDPWVTFDSFTLTYKMPLTASGPSPANEGPDVSRDSALTWSPGITAVQHNVYLGTRFEDVNSADVPTESGLSVTSFDPGRLEFGRTYYWRVDEIEGAPGQAVHRGRVWMFEVEPHAIPILGETIAVTASSTGNEFSPPANTINGSGLDANDMHDIRSETMWVSASVDLDPWIQYEFDGVKKLDTMKVWNANSAAESAIGWGVKDVRIEVSVDGDTWEALGDVTQFSRAPGAGTYDQYDEIDLGGAAARMVRLNILGNWGGVLMSYSLSEVQFSVIPVAARSPEPASGSVDIMPNDTASWRAGRQAAQHTVYVSTDERAVIDGTAPSVTSSTHRLDLGSLDLQLDETYYWRVDEVNDAEVPSVWAGPVWSLSTPAALGVDDFESYSNASPDRPFQTWVDGFGYSEDEFFPIGYSGNGKGAGIGHDIWSLSSPHYDGKIMETTETIPGSNQSLPFYYTNSSQTDRTWATPQDWTVGGAQALVLHFLGSEENTGGSLFVEINGQKVTYPDNTNLGLAQWHLWTIDLAALGINAEAVTSMSIGIDGVGSGMILIDDISTVISE